MPVSKSALVFLILVLTLSVFIAKISSIISVNIDALEDNGSDESNYSTRTGHKKNMSTIIGDSAERLLWFLQVSDTHISIFHDPTRVSDLHEFCRITVPHIKPAVVLASGDLTDAKAKDNMGSSQYEQEWIKYREVLDSCDLANHTIWLDIRGNHDNFNIPDEKSSRNFYRRYSQQGKNHPRSYLHQLQRGDTLYSFLALDACLDPGPRRPFNFVGMLGKTEADHVKGLIHQINKTGSNYTIWFGHYPTSCILSPGSSDVRSIIASQRGSLAYLCGHFHTLGGTVPHMYTLQQAGFLELELGDWKDNRLFRLLAIDHGLLSFVDLAHGQWPAVLVTNPKHALYHIPGREPTNLISSSTHIRILAFSLDAIYSVQVKLDDGDWLSAHQGEGPLYTLPWTPNKYNKGLHYIHVNVVDVKGRASTIVEPFSLDGTRIGFEILPRLILMCNISTVFQVFFGSLLFFCVVPLCAIKYMHRLVMAQRMKRPHIGIRYLQLWVKRFWVLATVDRIFYPLTLYAIYLTVGPWSVGAVIEDYIGAIFAWGIIVNGTYLPGSFTYAYGFLQLLVFQVPLTLILAYYLHQRLQWQISRERRPSTRMRYCLRQLPFVMLVVLQMVFAYFFWLAYGTMAFLLGPMRTWSVILSVVLWYQAITLPDYCFEEAIVVWGRSSNVTSPKSSAEHHCNPATQSIVPSGN